MHWLKSQVTIHSGIVKVNGVKEYHPYVTEDLFHDKQLVTVALHKLLERAADSNPENILVERDNGINYKSAKHFCSQAIQLEYQF